MPTARPAARQPRVRIALIGALAVMLLLAPAGAAAAERRSFTAERLRGRVAVFEPEGVPAAAVRRAALRVGRFHRGVRLQRVRRGIRRGRVRVRVPGRTARRLRRAARASARRALLPRLVVIVAGRRASRPAPAPRRPAVAPAPAPAVSGRVSGFETGDFSEFVGSSAWTGSVSVTGERAYEGARSAKGVFSGGASGAMRTWQSVSWGEGSDVWFGVALFVSDGSAYCYWNPLRWDNYQSFEGAGDVGGLTVDRGRLSVMRSRYGGEERELIDGGQLPTGRWVWLELHQRLSEVDGRALSELFVDGRRRGVSTLANSEGRQVNHLRFGAVNVAGSCSRPATMYFDRASISDGPRGPLD